MSRGVFFLFFTEIKKRKEHTCFERRQPSLGKKNLNPHEKKKKKKGRINRLTTRVSYVLPVSDDGGSTAEIARVLGGPAVGDIRSRCLRLADADAAPEARAVARLLAHRLPSCSPSPSSSASASAAKRLAREDWRRVVEGTHPLWRGVSEPYKHLIRSFLVHFHSEVLRAPLGASFDWRGGSVGNFFFAGARLFFRSLEAAAFLFCRVARAPEGAAVLPAVATESALALAAVLEDGSVLVGQNEISHPSGKGGGGAISRMCSSGAAVEGGSDDGGAVVGGGTGGATSGEDDDADDGDDGDEGGDAGTPSPAAVDKDSPAARTPLPSPVSRIFYLPPDDGGRHVAWEGGGGGGGGGSGGGGGGCGDAGGGGGDAAAGASAPRRESSSAEAAAASLVAEVFPAPNPRVLAALGAAEAVVYGMGSLWTSIAPSLVLEGVGEAVAAVRGPKVLLLNGSLDRETSLAPSRGAGAAAGHSGSGASGRRRPMAASDIAAAIASAARRERGASSSSPSSSSSSAVGVSASPAPTQQPSTSGGKSSRGSGSRKRLDDISPFVTTVLAPEGGEVEFDAARLLEMGVTRARTVRSRRGGSGGGRVEFDPDALVAALAEEVAAWRAVAAAEAEGSREERGEE